MNSTLRSLLFWMVLVIVGVLIWNFSTTFQAREEVIPFSAFVQQLDTNKIDKVTITGQEIVATYKDGERARTYAPSQYEGLGNKLVANKVEVDGQGANRQPVGDVPLHLGADPPDDRLLDLHDAADAERRQQGADASARAARGCRPQQKKVTFKDVAGVEEAKEELQEIIEFLRSRRSSRSWAGAFRRACC